MTNGLTEAVRAKVSAAAKKHNHRKAKIKAKSRRSVISIELTTREQAAIGKLQRMQGRHLGNAKKEGTLPVSAAAVIRESLRQRYSSVFSVGGSTLTNPFARA